MASKKTETIKNKHKKHMEELDAKEKQRILTLSVLLNSLSSVAKLHGVKANINNPNVRQTLSKHNVDNKPWGLDYDYMTFDPKNKENPNKELKPARKKPISHMSKKNPLKINIGMKHGRGGTRKMSKRIKHKA